jgi:hypothetical protein
MPPERMAQGKDRHRSALGIASAGVLREARVLNQVFSICELAHSVRSRSAKQSGSVEGLVMTESTKQRITGDVMILVIGLAILIGLIFVGAL